MPESADLVVKKLKTYDLSIDGSAQGVKWAYSEKFCLMMGAYTLKSAQKSKESRQVQQGKYRQVCESCDKCSENYESNMLTM